MSKELAIPHEQIANNQTITSEMERIFQAHGLDLHRHEVTRLEDDFKQGKRILTVKNRKYFIMGGR